MLILDTLASEAHTQLESPPMLLLNTFLSLHCVYDVILFSTWLHLHKRPNSIAIFHKCRVYCWVNLINCRTQYQTGGKACFILFQGAAFSMHLCPEPSSLFIMINSMKTNFTKNHCLRAIFFFFLEGGLTRTCFHG